MTDMRDPLTIDFHKARSRADLLRPDSVEDILDDRQPNWYRDAVHDYVAAFDVAEAEAIRKRRSDFRRAQDASSGTDCCGWRRTAARRTTSAGRLCRVRKELDD